MLSFQLNAFNLKYFWGQNATAKKYEERKRKPKRNVCVCVIVCTGGTARAESVAKQSNTNFYFDAWDCVSFFKKKEISYGLTNDNGKLFVCFFLQSTSPAAFGFDEIGFQFNFIAELIYFVLFFLRSFGSPLADAFLKETE